MYYKKGLTSFTFCMLITNMIQFKSSLKEALLFLMLEKHSFFKEDTDY